MATRNKTALGGGKSGKFSEEVSWVDVDLDKRQKELCKQWCNTLEEFDNVVQALQDNRYRLSIKPDDYSGGFAAFIQGLPDCEDNKNLILTGRGSTPLKALKQALYKHFMVLEGVWPIQKSKQEIEDWED